MAIQKLNGNDYIIFIDTTTPITESTGAAYRPVACMTSSGLSGSTNVIEVSDKCNDGFADAIPGNKTNTITGSGNAIDETLEPSMDSFEELLSLYQDGTEFWMKIANKTGNTATPVIREAVGFLTDYSETADTDTPYTFDFTFRAKGRFNTAVTT
ncbi:hypothetical protein G5B30_16475 [Sphingobacterium sp. SGG-5]|uniref:hypothetical protein n=1 Tax=Sphingobacterium sp. SGG-5 TaxID=2710881 RepID=UPI0013EC9DB3|nr:hypothetical protein [Sphingobacterium sp. SGG-5]NGM63506.1 hypothetical protein [Sphingobacterium sp. SGG-5]